MLSKLSSLTNVSTLRRQTCHATRAYPASSPTGLMSLNRVAKEKASNYHATRISWLVIILEIFAMHHQVTTILDNKKDKALLESLPTVISELITTNPTPHDLLASQSFLLGQGTWEVISAPHIEAISSTLGCTFSPIRYTLLAENLISNVFYSHPVLGEGWLSAGGKMYRKYDDSVEVSFDRFWVDGPSTLREDIPLSETWSNGGLNLGVDSVVSLLGKTAFFPQLAIFPILYLDQDLCVFSFPAMNSKIAVRKILGDRTLTQIADGFRDNRA